MDEENGQIATKVFQEGAVRGQFATFDKTKKNSANLLAGGAAAAIGANLLLDDDKNKKLSEAMTR